MKELLFAVPMFLYIIYAPIFTSNLKLYKINKNIFVMMLTMFIFLTICSITHYAINSQSVGEFWRVVGILFAGSFMSLIVAINNEPKTRSPRYLVTIVILPLIFLAMSFTCLMVTKVFY